jgi:hypothetical protein
MDFDNDKQPLGRLAATMLEEYKSLRQEILDRIKEIQQADRTGLQLIAVAGGVIAIANDLDVRVKAAMFAALAVMYVPLILGQVARHRSIYFIGRYIEKVLKPALKGLNWESSWHRGADCLGDAGRTACIKDCMLLFALQWITGITATCLSYSSGIVPAAVVALVLLGATGICAIQCHSATNQELAAKTFGERAPDIHRRYLDDLSQDDDENPNEDEANPEKLPV